MGLVTLVSGAKTLLHAKRSVSSEKYMRLRLSRIFSFLFFFFSLREAVSWNSVSVEQSCRLSEC